MKVATADGICISCTKHFTCFGPHSRLSVPLRPVVAAGSVIYLKWLALTSSSLAPTTADLAAFKYRDCAVSVEFGLFFPVFEDCKGLTTPAPASATASRGMRSPRKPGSRLGSGVRPGSSSRPARPSGFLGQQRLPTPLTAPAENVAYMEMDPDDFTFVNNVDLGMI